MALLISTKTTQTSPHPCPLSHMAFYLTNKAHRQQHTFPIGGNCVHKMDARPLPCNICSTPLSLHPYIHTPAWKGSVAYTMTHGLTNSSPYHCPNISPEPLEEDWSFPEFDALDKLVGDNDLQDVSDSLRQAQGKEVMNLDVEEIHSKGENTMGSHPPW